jgi:4,5:9,10-diseco-3-hydroxy-5,9,17-trioxoandrosta-1(10),2-diene-4-oate hydrolase
MTGLKCIPGGTAGKPPVVLLHGLGATRYTWHKTVELLKPNFETHALDMWGFGASWPVPAGFGYSMRDQAGAIIEYMVENKIEEVRLVGHSMGGGVCLQIVDLLNSHGSAAQVTVEKMVLVAPAARPIGGASLLSVLLLGKMEMGTDPNVIAQSLLDEIYVAPVAEKDVYAAKYAINFTSDRIKSVRRQTAQLNVLASFASNFTAYDIKTRLLRGQKDLVVRFNDHGVDLEKDLRYAKLVPIDNCGHVPHEEYPDKVNPMIAEFLKP